MTWQPKSADPDDIARKRAAAPTLKMPPDPEWTIDGSGTLIDYKMQGLAFRRKARNRLSELIFNSLVTHVPSHTVRLGFLRMFGATIGKGSGIMRGAMILDIEFLTVGDCTTIGGRCLLDSRAGLWIGNNVTIASDVLILGGGHDFDHPNFLPVPIPTVVEDYAWIASRAILLPSLIRRGAVVAAGAVVIKDVGECEVVGGNPAKVITKRNPDALQYSASYRPLFG